MELVQVLRAQLTKSRSAIESVQNETNLLEESERNGLAAIQECRNEQKDLLNNLTPELRRAIELGRQLERGFK